MSNENKEKFIAAIADDLFILPVSRRHEMYTKNLLCRRIGSMMFVAGSVFDDGEETRFAPFSIPMIRIMGMKEEDVMDAAIKQMVDSYPAEMMDISTAMEQCIANGAFPGIGPDQIRVEGELPDRNMIILTNKKREYGSAAILYPGVLRMVSDTHFEGKGFYILPCSAHEVICLPDDGMVDGKTMQMMVLDVNRSVVESKDYLSDQVYFYDPVNDEVVVEEA